MRITDVKHLIQILTHIRIGDGTNETHRRTGAHKEVIKRVQKMARENGWDNPSAEVPEEAVVNKAYRATFEIKEDSHYLDEYCEQIKKWKDAGESYVVISHKLTRIRDGVRVPETTLRDYYNRNIGKNQPVINRRPNDEYSIAELDFGYMGITYDHVERRNRKTWFLSLRLRLSRHSARRKLYICDTLHVLSALSSAFKELGGVPKRLVIDNFKVAIRKAHRYDPSETRAFRQFAMYYGFLIDACRPAMPEHKGGVESEVKYIKNNFWPLFRHDEKMRGHETPHGELIDRAFIQWDNEIAGKRPIKEAAGATPHELFTEESSHLSSLPLRDYEPYNEEQQTVKKDYHITYDKAFYSVPWGYVGKKVLIKAYAGRIQVLFDGELIALHGRSYIKGRRVTDHAHRPKNMIEFIEQTMPWLVRKAKAIGESTYSFIEILANDKVKYRHGAMIATIKLADKYGASRLEKACARAAAFGNYNYQSLKDILEKHKESAPEKEYSDKSGQTYLYARNSMDYDFSYSSKTLTTEENNNGYNTYTITPNLN